MSKAAIFRTCRQIAAALCTVLALSSPQPAHSLEKATLQLKWLHHYQFAGYYAALHQGFYREAGLDVTILEGHPDMEVEKRVAEGEVDFGTGTSALLLHRAKGLELVVLGQIFQHSPAVFLAPRKSGIRSIADIAGKRFMYSNQDGDILALLKKNGIAESDIVQVPHQGDPRDLINGKADVLIAYSFNEPFTLEQAGEPYLIFSPATFGIDFYGDNFFTSSRLIKERPEFVKAFREATLRGWRYTMDHKAEIADLILAKYSPGKSREWLLFEANQIETLIQPDLVEVGYQNPSRWQHISEVFIGLGMLPPGFDPAPVIYVPPKEIDHGFLFVVTAVAFVVITILTVVILKFRRLNRRLSGEIAERIESEKALSVSERKYADFFDLMPNIIGITRLKDGSFIEVNNGFVTGTGWTREEALGLTSLELGLWDSDTRARAVELARTNGHLENFEFIMTRKSGEKRRAVMFLIPTVIDGAEYLFFAAHDITEQKLAEEQLKESETFLRESQQAGMIGSYNFEIRNGIWTSNEVLDDIFGINAEYDRKVAGWVALIHPEDRHEMQEYLSGQVLGLKLPFDREYRIQRQCDGEVRWVHGHGRLHLDAQGDPERLVGVIQDVTERKQAEEERSKLELQLLQAQKLESLGILAGGIAHDFNNILTAIMGNISFARMDLAAEHHAYAPLARAEKAAQRAALLARQLLVFAKGGDPIKKPVSLQRIADDALSLTLSGTNIQGSIDLPPDLHAVNADEVQIHQAFHNIIINAVHAMPAGGRLTISGGNITLPTDNSNCLPGGDYVRICFRDEGCGIAADGLKRIFDPYFTTKAGGSGLGLASTYSIIKKHNGQITVSSTPGCGSTFTILLPSLSETSAEQTAPDSERPGIFGTGSILVMDDDEMIRELAATTLKRFGYVVTTCGNGTEAIDLYRSARNEGNPFSVVIMDLTIPGGMGGIEAARQILAFDPAAQLIVSSGYSADPVMANFTEYGFCASIEKPYRVEDISAILQGVKSGSAGPD